jgi:hypothetical protein
MANSTQPKIKPSTYTGLEVDDQINSDRVRVDATPARSGSSTTIIVVLAIAIAAALGYYYVSGTPVTNTAAPPVTTQVPAQPVPADPPAEVIQDPVPVTPAPAPVTPAPVAPAN